MRVLKIKSNIIMMNIKIEKYRDNYNYYMVAGNEESEDVNCLFEGTDLECKEFLDIQVKGYNSEYIASHRDSEPVYEGLTSSIYNMSFAI